MITHDNSEALLAQVKQLLAEKSQASIQGQGSRSSTTQTNIISLKKHVGVIAYEPSELVIKVHSGTLIKDIQQLLKDNKQQLGTDFPDYGNSTIGGAIATGETGTGRPFLGAIRDQVLGLGIINGKAEALNFGGQVMKNVAGYDVSRLLCGSLGQYALITDVTLKVVPFTPSITVTLEADQHNLQTINQLAAQALPITAAVIDQGLFHMRLSGSSAVTQHAMKAMYAKISQVDEHYWASIDNKQHPFFQTDQAIWQVRLNATQALGDYDGDGLIDWCGHQRYIKSVTKPQIANASILALKNTSSDQKSALLDDATQHIHKALKSAFDEHNIFN